MSKHRTTGIQHHSPFGVAPTTSAQSAAHDSSSLSLYVRDRQRPHQHIQPCQRWANMWVKPFVLGVIVAMLLSFLLAVTSIYAICHDVPMHEPLPRSSCAEIRILDKSSSEGSKTETTRSTFRGLLRFFRIRKRHQPEIRFVVLRDLESSETASYRSKACACRLIWDSLGYGIVDSSHRNTPVVCKRENQIGEAWQFSKHSADTSLSPRTSASGRDKFPTAFTPESPPLTTTELELVTRFSKQVMEYIPDLAERASNVPWGGPSNSSQRASEWFAFRKVQQPPNGSFRTPLEEVDGGNLLYSYLRIMKWPSNLFSHFPFKLCNNGCEAKVAIRHTLEFREKYKPWLVTPSVIQANKDGAVFHRGFSQDYEEGETGGHAIVWLRPALRIKVDDGFHIRIMVQALDRAVAASMKRSDGRVGKFNIVIDGTNFSLGLSPSFPSIKAFVTILQDHYVDRLGVVILVNTGRLCEVLLKLFLPLITEEVRNKIIVLPNDKENRKSAHSWSY